MFLALMLVLQLFACANKQQTQVTTTEVPAVDTSMPEPLEVVNVSNELKKLYDTKCIGLTSVKNPRDLGGYVNADGKKVKSNLLVRCGHLAKLSEEDEKIKYKRNT